MADKPIPFSAPMIRALMDGRKAQTRRVLDPQPSFSPGGVIRDGADGEMDCVEPHWIVEPRPRYAAGNRLWVREAYYHFGHWEPVPGVLTKGGKQKWAFEPESDEIRFDMPDGCRLGRHHKDPATSAWHKRLARFMPKAASRLTLIVESVKVERLQDINDTDAKAEGIFARGGTGDDPTSSQWTWQKEGWRYDTPREAFRHLWQDIHGLGAWDANPWVSAITFRVVKGNIDKIGGAA